ncbi:glycosyltransferase [Halomonas sp. CS7]|uniref:Glycosyltransferase n=1 Tax=Halomonas pelophila TaxID=3151122 RepID=A0ABV1N4C5_9GAMM
MKVLQLVNAYPTKDNVVKGVFIRDQIELLRESFPDLDVDVLVVDKEKKGIASYASALVYLLRKGGSYDVVHAHHVFCGVVAILGGVRKKLVTSFLSDSYNEVMLGPVFFRKFVYCVASHFSKCKIFKVYRNEVDGVRSFYLPNPVNTEFFYSIDRDRARELLGLEKGSLYALFVSGQSLLRPEKRYNLFCDIIDLYNKESSRDIIPIPIANATREEMFLYYNACNFYLLTSDFEGSPNAVKECLACGTSVIARDVGSVRQLLENLEGSSVVGSDVPEDYIDSINKAINIENPSGCTARLQDLSLDPLSSSQKLFNIYKGVVSA